MLTEAASSTEYVSGPAEHTGRRVRAAHSLNRALVTTVAARYTTRTHYYYYYYYYKEYV